MDEFGDSDREKHGGRSHAEQRKSERGDYLQRKLDWTKARLSKTGNPLAKSLVDYLQACHTLVFSSQGKNLYNLDQQNVLADLINILGMDQRPVTPRGAERQINKKTNEISLHGQRLENDRGQPFFLFRSDGPISESGQIHDQLEDLGIKYRNQGSILNFFERAKGPSLLVFNFRNGRLLEASFNPESSCLTLSSSSDETARIKTALPDPISTLESLFEAQAPPEK